jgi:hypothetical protein
MATSPSPARALSAAIAAGHSHPSNGHGKRGGVGLTRTASATILTNRTPTNDADSSGGPPSLNAQKSISLGILRRIKSTASHGSSLSDGSEMKENDDEDHEGDGDDNDTPTSPSGTGWPRPDAPAVINRTQHDHHRRAAANLMATTASVTVMSPATNTTSLWSHAMAAIDQVTHQQITREEAAAAAEDAKQIDPALLLDPDRDAAVMAARSRASSAKAKGGTRSRSRSASPGAQKRRQRSASRKMKPHSASKRTTNDTHKDGDDDHKNDSKRHQQRSPSSSSRRRRDASGRARPMSGNSMGGWSHGGDDDTTDRSPHKMTPHDNGHHNGADSSMIDTNPNNRTRSVSSSASVSGNNSRIGSAAVKPKAKSSKKISKKKKVKSKKSISGTISSSITEDNSTATTTTSTKTSSTKKSLIPPTPPAAEAIAVFNGLDGVAAAVVQKQTDAVTIDAGNHSASMTTPLVAVLSPPPTHGRRLSRSMSTSPSIPTHHRATSIASIDISSTAPIVVDVVAPPIVTPIPVVRIKSFDRVAPTSMAPNGVAQQQHHTIETVPEISPTPSTNVSPSRGVSTANLPVKRKSLKSTRSSSDVSKSSTKAAVDTSSHTNTTITNNTTNATTRHATPTKTKKLVPRSSSNGSVATTASSRTAASVPSSTTTNRLTTATSIPNKTKAKTAASSSSLLSSSALGRVKAVGAIVRSHSSGTATPTDEDTDSGASTRRSVNATLPRRITASSSSAVPLSESSSLELSPNDDLTPISPIADNTIPDHKSDDVTPSTIPSKVVGIEAKMAAAATSSSATISPSTIAKATATSTMTQAAAPPVSLHDVLSGRSPPGSPTHIPFFPRPRPNLIDALVAHTPSGVHEGPPPSPLVQRAIDMVQDLLLQKDPLPPPPKHRSQSTLMAAAGMTPLHEEVDALIQLDAERAIHENDTTDSDDASSTTTITQDSFTNTRSRTITKRVVAPPSPFASSGMPSTVKKPVIIAPPPSVPTTISVPVRPLKRVSPLTPVRGLSRLTVGGAGATIHVTPRSPSPQQQQPSPEHSNSRPAGVTSLLTASGGRWPTLENSPDDPRRSARGAIPMALLAPKPPRASSTASSVSTTPATSAPTSPIVLKSSVAVSRPSSVTVTASPIPMHRTLIPSNKAISGGTDSKNNVSPPLDSSTAPTITITTMSFRVDPPSSSSLLSPIPSPIPPPSQLPFLDTGETPPVSAPSTSTTEYDAASPPLGFVLDPNVAVVIAPDAVRTVKKSAVVVTTVTTATTSTASSVSSNTSTVTGVGFLSIPSSLSTPGQHNDDSGSGSISIPVSPGGEALLASIKEAQQQLNDEEKARSEAKSTTSTPTHASRTSSPSPMARSGSSKRLLTVGGSGSGSRTRSSRPSSRAATAATDANGSSDNDLLAVPSGPSSRTSHPRTRTTTHSNDARTTAVTLPPPLAAPRVIGASTTRNDPIVREALPEADDQQYQRDRQSFARQRFLRQSLSGPMLSDDQRARLEALERDKRERHARGQEKRARKKAALAKLEAQRQAREAELLAKRAAKLDRAAEQRRGRTKSTMDGNTTNINTITTTIRVGGGNTINNGSRESSLVRNTTGSGSNGEEVEEDVTNINESTTGVITHDEIPEEVYDGSATTTSVAPPPLPTPVIIPPSPVLPSIVVTDGSVPIVSLSPSTDAPSIKNRPPPIIVTTPTDTTDQPTLEYQISEPSPSPTDGSPSSPPLSPSTFLSSPNWSPESTPPDSPIQSSSAHSSSNHEHGHDIHHHHHHGQHHHHSSHSHTPSHNHSRQDSHTSASPLHSRSPSSTITTSTSSSINVTPPHLPPSSASSTDPQPSSMVPSDGIIRGEGPRRVGTAPTVLPAAAPILATSRFIAHT